MEMVPMRVLATPGQVVNFVCAYFSIEQLEIDIKPIGPQLIDGKLASSSTEQHKLTQALMLGPPVRDMLDRFPWGSRRSLSLEIDSSHKQVKCRVTNLDGQILGELTALIQTEGFHPNPNTPQNKNTKSKIDKPIINQTKTNSSVVRKVRRNLTKRPAFQYLLAFPLLSVFMTTCYQ